MKRVLMLAAVAACGLLGAAVGVAAADAVLGDEAATTVTETIAISAVTLPPCERP
jgi:hypothetical protein